MGIQTVIDHCHAIINELVFQAFSVCCFKDSKIMVVNAINIDFLDEIKIFFKLLQIMFMDKSIQTKILFQLIISEILANSTDFIKREVVVQRKRPTKNQASNLHFRQSFHLLHRIERH